MMRRARRKMLTAEQSHSSALNSFIFVILHVPRYIPEEALRLKIQMLFIAVAEESAKTNKIRNKNYHLWWLQEL